MPITFTCKECNAKQTADESKTGTIVACTKCGKELTVPAPKVHSPHLKLSTLGLVLGAVSLVPTCLLGLVTAPISVIISLIALRRIGGKPVGSERLLARIGLGAAIVGLLIAALPIGCFTTNLDQLGESAKGNRCVTSLGSICNGLASYAKTFDGKLPGTFTDLLVVGEITTDHLLCPANPDAANLALKAREKLSAFKAAGGAREPAKEELMQWDYVLVRYETLAAAGTAPLVIERAPRHLGGYNVLFGDQRIERITQADFPKRMAEEAEKSPAFKAWWESQAAVFTAEAQSTQRTTTEK